MQVVHEQEGRLERIDGAMGRLEHAHRLESVTVLEDDRGQATSGDRATADRLQKGRRRRQRYLALGLVADHSEAMLQRRSLGQLVEEARLPGPGVADDHGSGRRIVGCRHEILEDAELLRPPDERRHAPSLERRRVRA